uniref:Uncharacterized protein TCIL3000_11_14450 n=1 Tax=Trypanosoma congolense (strain IL3000) TaxID=1068625 RepID=G0V2Q7_TRYCI|nr:unnamed protein product [Trypanosoma congolense IL3000]
MDGHTTRPMVLPYVDMMPSIGSMVQARSMVQREANQAEGNEFVLDVSVHREKLKALRDQQLADAKQYKAANEAMSCLWSTLTPVVASGSDVGPCRKRPRDADTPSDDVARSFEGNIMELLEMEIMEHVLNERPHAGDQSEGYGVVLRALQNIQKLLRDTRRQTEEVNAIRQLEQQQYHVTLAEKIRLLNARLRNIKALKCILQGSADPRRSSLLSTLE